ncbi:MAG: cytochrome c oxidase subunit I [Dehalococcoidia bacterium]|nr:cytochrome c oxidase subunit I [Dehalococcoidia bacterium]
MAAVSGALPRWLQRPTTYSGLWGWVVTVDHKRIGVMYGVTAFAFFLVGGIEAVTMRLQLATPANTLVNPDTFSQLFSMHALTMIFLAIMPLSAAFFNIIIPLQIGARDVAFPRLNALSYWVFLFGGLLLNAGWLFGRSPGAGWFAYSNLTSGPFSPGSGMDYYVLGLLVLGTASMAAGFNFVVTIINMRAPGMTLMRMPLFTWMTLVTSFLLVLAMPVITVALIELGFDRFAGTNFFRPEGGGDPILWQHLFWVFGHPEVYILILPAMGIVSEVLPTFSRKPLFGYPVVVLSGVFIGFMGWAVWSHHMFTVGLGPIANATFAITTMFIALPTGVKVFSWIATMWGGSIEFKTAMLFAIGFIVLFIIGGLSGVSHASPPADAQQQDTYYIVAHIHYVLFGGSIFGLFSGMYYWFPKATGHLLHEGLGKLHFWLAFIGMNITFAPMHWLGLDGMPRRIYTYNSNMGWDFWNLVATAGSLLIAVSTLVFLWNVFTTMRKEKDAPADPWDGRTLEWSISSPPPIYNFRTIPNVYARDAFWHQKYVEGSDGRPRPVPTGGATAHSEGHEAAESPHDIHMPGLSYFPIILALGLALTAAGIMIHLAVVAAGVLITFFGIYGWAFEPADPE